jgi:hypothetical protein
MGAERRWWSSSCGFQVKVYPELGTQSQGLSGGGKGGPRQERRLEVPVASEDSHASLQGRFQGHGDRALDRPLHNSTKELKS